MKARYTSSSYGIPAWFLNLLAWYREKHGDTFTKYQLASFALRIGCSAAPETIYRYIRYACAAGILQRVKRTRSGKVVYRIARL